MAGTTGRAGGTWWADAVVLQVYPRSFQDSDGDGRGDLAGITARLGHVRALGADAIWLSPVFPSPMADGGYDVASFDDVAPGLGTLADLDALIARAHELGLKVLLDVVPCHTSIEHPWFTEHPERYVWSDRDGPQNNWRSTFGGPAWSPDPHGRGWYLHSFYPEQPDLDWRHPGVRAELAAVLARWRARGVDGFRLDAIDRVMKDPALRDDPPAGGPPLLPTHPDHAALEHLHSRDAPDVGVALAALRAGAGADAFLAGEVYLPSDRLAPYLEHLDVAFAFELFHARWDAASVRAAIAAGVAAGRVAWVLSNHDFPRLPTRVGAAHVRGAALLALALPGVVFLFQGDEIGMPDGPGGDPPDDRAGRDPHRHPMRWDDREPHGGFTAAGATPWLPAVPVPGGGVAQQEHDPGSLLHLTRALVALRRTLAPGLTLLAGADEDVVAFTRGEEHVVAVNLADAERRAPAAGRLLASTRGRVGSAPAVLAPGEGIVASAAV